MQPAETHIGRYQLVEHLATGGMAQVYLACERSVGGFERLVVIKRLRSQLAGDDQVVAMFIKEARLVARLTHPNIVQIHELGEGEDGWYIAMEYVKGASFRDLQREAVRRDEKLPLGVVVGLVAQGCAGLHAAHELTGPQGQPLGLVHRDVSPDNLMVTPDGHVKLLDFGIAKATADADATVAGSLKGKINYMSPEQCQGMELDRRSDVFSLGVVLWELLAGRRLFKRASEVATMNAIISGTLRDLHACRPDVPDGMVGVARKALSLDPEDRYQSADLLRRALLEAAGSCGLQTGTDVIADYVGQVVGERIYQREIAVKDAVERTLYSGGHPVIELPTDTSVVTGSVPTQAMEPLNREGGRTFWLGLGLLAALGAAAALVVAAGLAIVFWPAGAGAPGPALEGPPLVMGLSPVMDEAPYLENFEPLRLYLEEETGRPVQFEVASTYAEQAQRVVSGQVGFASLPPALYVRTAARSGDVRILAIKRIEGAAGNDGILLVRAEAEVGGLADLAGKRLCLADEQSASGYLLPRLALRKAGVDPDRDLAEVRLSGNHMAAIRDLLADRCDAAATYSGGYLAADRAGLPVGALRVLTVTGRIPNDAIVAGPGAEPTDADAMQKALLAFDPLSTTGERSLGTLERISGYAPGDDHEYDALREAVAAEEEAERAATGAP